MRYFLWIFLSVVWLATGVPVSAAPVGGPAASAGPGLIAIGGKTIRLWGILMPGRETSEGVIAYQQFEKLIDGRVMECVPTVEDVGPVSDAICRTGDGMDVAAFLVTEGWALDDGVRSRGYYLDEMEQAAARRRGIWGLTTSGPVSVEATAEAPALPDPEADPPEPSLDTSQAALVDPEPVPTDKEPGLGEPEVAEPEVAEPAIAERGAAEPVEAAPIRTWLQVGAGRSPVQRTVEMARLRSTQGWLFEQRDVVMLDPDGAQGRYRAVVALEPEEFSDVCARLATAREACLLIQTR